MSLYPTLEDLKVDEMAKTQAHAAHAIQSGYSVSHALPGTVISPSLYPALTDYMGLDLNQAPCNQQQMVPSYGGGQVATIGSGWGAGSGAGTMVAPVTGMDVGIRKAEIKQGLRQLLLCKDGKGKLGVVVQGVNKGVFVCFVYENSPAALVGMRFGDQILEINSQVVAGWSTDKTMDFLKKCSPEKVTIVVRDRPFERTVTMNKDSVGKIGFVYKDGKITALVKDSSAARNGLLIDHQLIEINGRNVVGLKDKDVQAIIDRPDRTVTVTVMPCFVYDHIIKQLGSGLMKKHMDRSDPEV